MDKTNQHRKYRDIFFFKFMFLQSPTNSNFIRIYYNLIFLDDSCATVKPSQEYSTDHSLTRDRYHGGCKQRNEKISLWRGNWAWFGLEVNIHHHHFALRHKRYFPFSLYRYFVFVSFLKFHMITSLLDQLVVKIRLRLHLRTSKFK